MLWDIWQQTRALQWSKQSAQVYKRLHVIRDRYGAEVLARFGVPAVLPIE